MLTGEGCAEVLMELIWKERKGEMPSLSPRKQGEIQKGEQRYQRYRCKDRLCCFNNLVSGDFRPNLEDVIVAMGFEKDKYP